MHINLGADLYKIQISTKIPIGTLFKKFICPFKKKKKKKIKKSFMVLERCSCTVLHSISTGLNGILPLKRLLQEI